MNATGRRDIERLRVRLGQLRRLSRPMRAERRRVLLIALPYSWVAFANSFSMFVADSAAYAGRPHLRRKMAAAGQWRDFDSVADEMLPETKSRLASPASGVAIG
jgi:hypothetical protein